MTTTMPTAVGIRFAHAAVQVLAEDHGVDLLHIKGPAVDADLLGVQGSSSPNPAAHGEVHPRRSIDADVLVRPMHVRQLLQVMGEHGWTMKYRFEDGSAFEHAATLVHPFLAPVDVHRRFPGIGVDADAAFERLWTERHVVSIAGTDCAVPSLPAQRLILLLHAARTGGARHPDVGLVWSGASMTERGEVERLARDLGAEVALAAAVGGLSAHRHRPEHDLWALLSSGEGTKAQMWLARVRAVPTWRGRLKVGVRLVVPKPGRLAQELGHQPTRGELLSAYVRRAGVALAEVGKSARARRGRSGP